MLPLRGLQFWVDDVIFSVGDQVEFDVDLQVSSAAVEITMDYGDGSSSISDEIGQFTHVYTEPGFYIPTTTANNIGAPEAEVS